MILSRYLTLLVVAIMLVPAADARILCVGPGREFAAPSAAIAASKDGDTVRIDAGKYIDCAIVATNHLTIEGVGPNASAVITDKVCGGKALLITNGANITIRNITLQNARIAEGNGAGIRAQGNKLTIDHVKFINNENGILAGDIPNGEILIRDSDFLRNGSCARACAHGVYVGHIALLLVERSRFVETSEAHHIKSRARRTEVIGCDFADGETGTSSYQIEAPNGGNVIERDNTMQKGPKTGNQLGAVVIGLGGVDQPTREIVIEGNRFTVDGGYPSFLVINRTATEVQLNGNVLVGTAKLLDGPGRTQ